MEKVAAVEDPGLIHSDDGAFTVRLGVAITEPKEKVDGAHVAVIEATLVTPCEKTSASQHQDKKSLEVLEQTVTLCNLCQLRANARPAGMTLSSCQFFPEGRVSMSDDLQSTKSITDLEKSGYACRDTASPSQWRSTTSKKSSSRSSQCKSRFPPLHSSILISSA